MSLEDIIEILYGIFLATGCLMLILICASIIVGIGLAFITVLL